MLNNPGTTALLVDDVVVVAEEEPFRVAGHLLRAKHVTNLAVRTGREPAVLQMPLPLDHGVQTPLYAALRVDPPELGATVGYEVDSIGNVVAQVTFPAQSASAVAVVAWEAVVLTIEAPPADLPDLYPADRDPANWLAPTAIVQADAPAIAATAAEITEGLADPEDQMAAIIAWTSSEVTYGWNDVGLDALSVFEHREGTSTGFANLAAALGRAAGLPARTVANCPVGMALQTHALVEFWLGVGRGWRLVEPQATQHLLPADFTVTVRLDQPEDEGDEAMAMNAWSAQGVPLNSLVRPLQGAERLTWDYEAQPFPGCQGCDNAGAYQALLPGEPAEPAPLFARVRAAWQHTLTELGAGGFDAVEQEVRAAALEAGDVAAVQQLVETLEALGR